MPHDLSEVTWEPQALATVAVGVAAVQTAAATADAIRKLKPYKAQKFVENLGMDETCPNPPYSAPGMVPPTQIKPCLPSQTSYLRESIKDNPFPVNDLLKQPFKLPAAPSVAIPSAHYRGFGLFELSRKKGFYRFELPGIKYWVSHHFIILFRIGLIILLYLDKYLDS